MILKHQLLQVILVEIVYPYYSNWLINERPVISWGFCIPKISKIVGATSANVFFDVIILSSESYKDGDRERQSYQDGVIQDYIELFYRAGDTKSAEKYGKQIAQQVESVVHYFVSSDIRFIGAAENSEDFYANLAAFFKVQEASKKYNPKGELATYTTSTIDNWYGNDFKRMSEEIKQLENTKSEFDLYIELIGIHFNKLKGTAPKADMTGQEKMDTAMMRQMMNAAKVKTDSIKKNSRKIEKYLKDDPEKWPLIRKSLKPIREMDILPFINNTSRHA